MIHTEDTISKENIQLLIEDLCGRLPYGVMVAPADMHFYAEELSIISLEGRGVTQTKQGTPTYIINTMPYLRPMNTMTEEEEIEYDSTFDTIEVNGHSDSVMTYKSFVFLNKKMFDYRGLIDKGLALNVYDYSEKGDEIYSWLPKK
jgi:hypothetical protein